MDIQNPKKDENEGTLEDSVVENEKAIETSEKENAIDAGKGGEAVAGKEDNVVVEASAREESKEDEKFVETSMDAKQEEEAVNLPAVLTSVDASSSGIKRPKGLPVRKKIVKKVKRLVKKKRLQGTAVQVAGEENVAVEQGTKEAMTVEQSAQPSFGESKNEIMKDQDSVADSPQCKGILVQPQGTNRNSSTILQGPKEGMDLDAERVVEASVEAPENVVSVKKPQPKKVKAKAKLSKTPPALSVKSNVDITAPQVDQNDKEENESLATDKQQNGVTTSEAEKTKPQQSTEDRTGTAENKRSKKRRRGKQVLDSNKKQRDEVVAAVADVTQQRMEEKKEQLVGPEDGHGKAKIAGLIFMCNAKTRPDCFRFSVLGVQEKRKDYVMGIKPGIKLFLYDYDLKLMYGIFQASSAGGMKLERNAFGGSFPAQVRFKVVSDCLPLPESQFKKAIKENYNNRNKFKTELTRKQVFKLMNLFKPAATIPAQLTHTLPAPAVRDTERKRSGKDRYAPGSSNRTRTYDHAPPPLREEPSRDLYLTEREYRAYGLRRGETSQHHYQIPPPASTYQDRVPLDSYRPSLAHDHLLRNAEMERSDRREVRLLHLPERDYHLYEHQSMRREVLARDSPDAPVLDSYRRDPHHHRYEYRSPERLPRAYLASSLGREGGDDLYSRYVTADSLAEYYRSSSSHRYPSIPESELPPSSRYHAYSGSLPYSHRL